MGGRGREHGSEERRLILELVEEAVCAGARIDAACKQLGVCSRSVERWRKQGGGADGREGPRTPASNQLSDEEKKHVIETANLPEYRDKSPRQIVPLLADKGIYIASESTFYRVLAEAGQLAHRSRSRPATNRRPMEHVARRPNEVWSWDITYLRTQVRGCFYYLYLVVDVFSRKIVGFDVHEEECARRASELVSCAVADEGVDKRRLVLHADNGGPMKASTMLATLERLGVVASFSRPRVSDDNPFAEALFRTMKYRPEYPRKPLADHRRRPRAGGSACCAAASGKTTSTSIVAFDTSRRPRGTTACTPRSSPTAAPSMPLLGVAIRGAGAAIPEIGRSSAPCSSTRSDRRSELPPSRCPSKNRDRPRQLS